MPEPILSAHGIARTYGAVLALDGLTFEARAGEVIGLLGPNGAGKTTAIRVLTTILPPSRGHFSVLGVPDTRPQAIRAMIGVLPESGGFPAGVTGAEYLAYMGRLYGLSQDAAQNKAATLLVELDLEVAGRSRIAGYSRGMKQRLMVARALVNDPKLLVLDEPTLGLDPKGQREMLRRIRSLAAAGRAAVILSSHSLEVVEGLCDRVLIMNRGRVIAQGSVAEITRRIAAPRTCRVQVPADAVPRALAVLSALAGVKAERHSSRADELIVALQAARTAGDANAVLGAMVAAEIPVQAFSRETARLDDAFLKLIEETRA